MGDEELIRRIKTEFLGFADETKLRLCPVCKEKTIQQCRCMYSEMKCKNDHYWHFHEYQERYHGEAPHDGTHKPNECERVEGDPSPDDYGPHIPYRLNSEKFIKLVEGEVMSRLKKRRSTCLLSYTYDPRANTWEVSIESEKSVPGTDIAYEDIYEDESKERALMMVILEAFSDKYEKDASLIQLRNVHYSQTGIWLDWEEAEKNLKGYLEWSKSQGEKKKDGEE